MMAVSVLINVKKFNCGILVCSKTESILTVALKKDLSVLLDEIVSFHDEFRKSCLERQLTMIGDTCRDAYSVADVVAQLRRKSPDLRSIGIL